MILAKILPKREIVFRGSQITVEYEIKQLGLKKNYQKTQMNKLDPYNFMGDIYFTNGDNMYIVFDDEEEMNVELDRILDRLKISSQIESTKEKPTLLSKFKNFIIKK